MDLGTFIIGGGLVIVVTISIVFAMRLLRVYKSILVDLEERIAKLMKRITELESACDNCQFREYWFKKKRDLDDKITPKYDTKN
jgi:flagellar biosynthesis chaperone FliJ